MRPTVAVIGGGPGGLFVSRMLALRHPSWSVTVYDRLGLDETLGFGIGLSGSALNFLAQCDPETRQAVEEHAFSFREAGFWLPTGKVNIPGFTRGYTIGRARLRSILHDQAVKAGVRVVLGQGVDVDDLRREADLVIAADGVSSQTRERYRAHFGKGDVEGRAAYLWCGADTPLSGTIFQPVATEHGVFTTHAYPYEPDRSTFVVETSAETLAKAGLHLGTPDLDNDERSLEYLSDAFSEVLDGHRLRGNRSTWFHFRTVICPTWVYQNVALLGDAAATADPSIGSGTKLALESALALVNALDKLPDKTIEECLHDYDALRRPAVEGFQELSLRSQRWWDTLPRRLHLQGERLAVAYLTRGGAVNLDAALKQSGTLIRPAVASWAQVGVDRLPMSRLAEWIVNRPLILDAGRSATRMLTRDAVAEVFKDRIPEALVIDTADPWGQEADHVVAQARASHAAGAPFVLLAGGAERRLVLNRLHVAERVRTELDCVTAIEAQSCDVQDVAAGLISARIDFACVTDLDGTGGRRQSGKLAEANT
jgi:anthraniloyl-CoA monooxygenase